MKALISILLVFLHTALFAGGWDNSLIGARPAGMATAFVGIADDATAIYYNTAGLAFAESRAQFILCSKSYFPTHKYINSMGEKSTSEITATLVELFTYYRLNDSWTLGFGVFTPTAGGGMKWAEKEIGYSIDGHIGTLSLSPTLSLKVFSNLAVGVNLNYLHVVSSQKVNDPFGYYLLERFEIPGDLFNSENLIVDNFVLDASEKGSEYTFTGSLFYKPSKKLSLGFAYHGPTDVEITGRSSIDGKAAYDISPFPSIPIAFLGNYDSATKFYLPASYAFGVSFRIRPRFLISAEYDYYQWSKLKNVDKINTDVPIFINDVPLEETGLVPEGTNVNDWIYSEPLGFNNSYYLKFGAEYLYSENIAIRFGTSYDNGKVSNEAYSLTNIDVSKLNFLAGIGYKLGSFNVNLAGFLQIGKEEYVPAEPNNETYDLDSMGFLASIVSRL